MSKAAFLHRSSTARHQKDNRILRWSDNECGVKLPESEYPVLASCVGCGCRFVPTGRQRYCSHACYSGTLRTPIQQRFWTKVNKTSGCWLWAAATIRGYGQISLNRTPAYAHRLSWEFAYGPIPAGSSVLHACDVPLCVRPDHLFLGTQQDNLADARRKGRLDESRPRTSTLTYEDRLTIFSVKPYRGVCVDLARRYGVTKTCISQIRKGRFARPKTDLGPRLVSAASALDRVFERVPAVRVPVIGEVA